MQLPNQATTIKIQKAVLSMNYKCETVYVSLSSQELCQPGQAQGVMFRIMPQWAEPCRHMIIIQSLYNVVCNFLPLPIPFLFVPGQVSLNASSVVCYVQQPYPLGWSQLQLQWLCMSSVSFLVGQLCCYTCIQRHFRLSLHVSILRLACAVQDNNNCQSSIIWNFGFCVCFYQLLNALFCLLCPCACSC